MKRFAVFAFSALALIYCNTKTIPEKINHDDETKAKYDIVWESSRKSIRKGEISVDSRWKNGNKKVLTWTTAQVKQSGFALSRLEKIIREISLIEPDQFYHRTSWLHTTVVIFSSNSYESFEEIPRNEKILETYGPVIKEAIKQSELRPFTLRVKGITGGTGSIFANVYENGNVDNLRNEIIKILEEKNIPYKKPGKDAYVLPNFKNHSTIARFREKLKDPVVLEEFINENRERDLGWSDICQVDLIRDIWVANDNGKMELFQEPIATFCIE